MFAKASRTSEAQRTLLPKDTAEPITRVAFSQAARKIAACFKGPKLPK
jgi:hypothetical protein